MKTTAPDLLPIPYAPYIRVMTGKPSVLVPDTDDADADAPSCRECGDYLTGDKWSGYGCPSCAGSASWRFA